MELEVSLHPHEIELPRGFNSDDTADRITKAKIPVSRVKRIDVDTKPKVEITKSQSASQAHGRGSDSYRTSGKYDAKIDGTIRGRIWADKAGYIEKPLWNIARIDPDGKSNIRPIHITRSHRAAIEWSENNHDKFV